MEIIMAEKWKLRCKRIVAWLLVFLMSVTSLTFGDAGAVQVAAAGVSDSGGVELRPTTEANWYDRINLPQYGRDLYMSVQSASNYSKNILAGRYLIYESALKSADYRLKNNSMGTFYAKRITTINRTTEMEDGDTDDLNIRQSVRAAFDVLQMDHPEVFWLIGEPKIYREESGSNTSGYVYTYYLMTSCDKRSYDIRESAYIDVNDASSRLLTNKIDKFEAEVNSIVGKYASQDDAHKVASFQEELIKKANYACEARAGSTFYANQSLAPIMGAGNPDGAVPTDIGYAKAMKVLCDKAGIPCVITEGTVNGQAHMWNYVYMNDTDAWYAVDVAADAALSSAGSMSQKWLLVGSESIVDKASSERYGDSHVGGANQLYTGGTDLPASFAITNEPELSTTRYILNPIRINGVIIKAPTKGSGTAQKPYQISTEEQLFWFAALINGELEDGAQENACAILQENITIGHPWVPIGKSDTAGAHDFKGVFDGNYKTISGLNIDSGSSDKPGSKWGLFGSASGMIKNLHLAGATYVNPGTGVTCGAMAGSLASGGTIDYCYVDGTVSQQGGSAQTIGGMVYENRGNINHSYTLCGNLKVTGDNRYTASFFLDADDTSAEPEGKTQREFAGGAVTWALNEGNEGEATEPIWRQNIDMGSIDPYPVWYAESGVVYYSTTDKTYSNKRYLDIASCFVNTNYAFNNANRDVVHVELPEDVKGNPKIYYSVQKATGDVPDENKWRDYDTFDCTTFAPGVYFILATMEGALNYSDAQGYTMFTVTSKSFALDPEITGLTITLNYPSDAKIPYSGKDVTPLVTVRDGSRTLTSGSDYRFEAYSPKPYNAASAGVKVWRVTGINDYTGYRDITFEITKADAGVRIASSYPLTYDYNANNIASPTDEQIIRDNQRDDPNATVRIAWYRGDQTSGELDESEKLGNTETPKNAGAYTLVVTVISATGNYEDSSVRKLVTINKIKPTKDLYNTTSFDDSYEFDGREKEVTIQPNGGVEGLGELSVRYRKSGSSNYIDGKPKDAGTYEVVAVIAEGDNYLASTVPLGTFTITPKPLAVHMFQLDVTQYYKGMEIRPDIDTSAEPFLTTDDYTASYRDNTSIGTATVTFTGKRNYSGSVSMQFEIKPKTLPQSDFYRLECLGTVVDYTENWYTGGVRIYPGTVPGKTMTIWRNNSSIGSPYIDITTEGTTNCQFYLKDGDGYIYYMEKDDGTYGLADMDFNIDLNAPSFIGGGLKIGNQTVTTSNNMLGNITFRDSEIYTESLTGSVQAQDKYSGVATCYYYVYSYTGEENSIKPLTKEELDAITFYEASENVGEFSITNDGRYVVYAYAVDHAGNKSGYICTQGITIDTIPPEIVGVIEPKKSNNTLMDVEATVQFKASEYGTFYYILQESGASAPTVDQVIANGTSGAMSGGSADSYQNFIKLKDLKPSTEYVLYIAAKDKAGNKILDVKAVPFKTLKIIPRFDKQPTWSGVYGTMIKDMEVKTEDINSTNGATGTWSIKDPSTSANTAILQVNDESAPMITLVYTPDDTEKYETIEVSVQPTVIKRPVTVTIPDVTKVYGEEMTTIKIDGVTMTGATPEESIAAACQDRVTSDYSPIYVTRNGITDTVADLSIHVTIRADKDTDAGTYAVEGASTSRNYDVTFVNGTIEIIKATPVITIGTASYVKVFGDGRFALEGLEHTNTDVDGVLQFEVINSKPETPGEADEHPVIDVLAKGDVDILGAGSAKIRVSLPETKNYFAVPGTANKAIEVRVNKRDSQEIAPETRRYVYAAGSKDAPVLIDLNEKVPQDKGAMACTVTKVVDDHGMIKDGKVEVDADGNLTYEVNRGDESQIGQGADITVEYLMQNYKKAVALIHIEWRDKILVKQSSTNPVSIVGGNTLIYGDKLDQLVLNSDTVIFVEDEEPETGIEVAGELRWISPGEAFDAGTESADWEYVLEDTETYREPVRGTLPIVIERASANLETPTATISPDEGNECVYNPTRTLEKDVRILGDNGTWTVAEEEVTVEGTWSWEEGATVPTVDKTEYPAVFTPNDTKNYQPVTKMVALTTTKAVPYLVEKPAAAEITYGEMLSAATFSGGLVRHSEDMEIAGYDTLVPGTFRWELEEEKPWVRDSEKTIYTVIFTPDDAIDYEIITTEMTVKVNPAEWPPLTPEDTLHVPFAVKGISGVDWPENWIPKSYEAGWDLNELSPVTVEVRYEGEDSGVGNYVNEEKSVTVIRAACEHEGDKEYRNAKVPTCTKEGYTGDTYCAIEGCGRFIVMGEVIPELGHDLDTTHLLDKKEPTCTEDGYAVYPCKRCGREAQVELLSLNHDWSSEYTIEEVTCTEIGRKYISCNRCGEINEGTMEVTEALGHIGGEATCTKLAVCDRCGESYGALDANHHLDTEVRNATTTSCSHAGYTGDVYCNLCGVLVKKGENIAAMPHTWQPGAVTQQPTCTAAGAESLVCSVCGEKGTHAIEPIGHKWETTLTVDKQPTAMEQGSKSIHCSNCGTSKPGTAVSIPKLNITNGSAVYDSQANYTVTKTGSQATVEYTGTKTNSTTVNIPATVKINGKTYKVTAIAANAFKNNKKITKAVIGSNVKKIGKSAFAGCTKLSTVSIGSKVTEIGDSAFANCTKLKTLTIGKNVATIGAKAFYKCSALAKVTIPAKVKKIGSQAFMGCKKLKNITVKTTKLKASKVGSKAFKQIHAKAVVKTPSGKKASYKKIFTSKGAGKKVTYK